MKILRSGIEVTPEELKELGIRNRVSHCCPAIPTGCSGQPGGCIDWHIPGSEVQKNGNTNDECAKAGFD